MAARATLGIIPAAGLGRRILPATRAIPKELLPVGRRTALDFLAEEALLAGLTDLVIVSSPDKAKLFATHVGTPAFDSPEDRAVADLYAKLRMHIAIQAKPSGLGDAVRVGRDAARELGAHETVAVLLPDEIHDGGHTLRALLDAAAANDGSTIGAFHTSPGEIVNYGALDIERIPQLGRLMRVFDVIEKPTMESAPSNYAIAGRYVLGPDILATLDEIEPSARGEIELTDAIALAALRERPVFALPLAARHFDLGSWTGYGKAFDFLAR